MPAAASKASARSTSPAEPGDPSAQPRSSPSAAARSPALLSLRNPTMPTPAQIIKQNYLATQVEFKPWWVKSRTVEKTLRQRMGEVINANESPRSSTDIYSTQIPAIAEINALKTKIREHWESNTLPYGRDSVRLLRRVDLDAFNKYMTDAAAEIAVLAGKVNDSRDTIIEDARKRRGDAFRLSDYPIDLSSLY